RGDSFGTRMGILAELAGDLPCLRERAHPRRYLEATGRRMALLGHADGVFECWMWPLKLLHDLQLSLRIEPGPILVPGRDLVSQVLVRPEGLALSYVHPRFTLEVEWLAALEERELLALFWLHGPERIELEVSFVPDLVPMWPAGLGGQIAMRDEETGSLVL